MPDAEDAAAIRVWNMLANGMGGLDWSGLLLAVEMYGVDDVEGLIERLLVIKSHKVPDEGDAPPP